MGVNLCGKVFILLYIYTLKSTHLKEFTDKIENTMKLI